MERTRSASLIKTALHLPKCLKPKVSSNSQNTQTHHHNSSQSGNSGYAGSGSFGKSIKKSLNNVTLPHKSSFRSKSDNCLHKIHQNQNVNNNQYNNNQDHQQIVDCEEGIKKSFSQKLAKAFASLVQSNSNSENSSNQATSNSPTSNSTIENVENLSKIYNKNEIRRNQSDHRTSKVNSAAIVKSTSLERNINCRLTQAEEQARRTRSLERNHRHLVTIDSTCR